MLSDGGARRIALPGLASTKSHAGCLFGVRGRLPAGAYQGLLGLNQGAQRVQRRDRDTMLTPAPDDLSVEGGDFGSLAHP